MIGKQVKVMKNYKSNPVINNITTAPVVSDTYHFIKKIGSGSFGDVYLTERVKDNRIFAAKVESRYKNPKLVIEYNIFTYLYNTGFGAGLPKVYTILQTPEYNMMFMQLLGSSLDSMFKLYTDRFELPTVMQLALQLISLLERLHKFKYIHRDIKPGNFLIGESGDNSNIYIIDFGLSKKYINGGVHIPIKQNRSLVGTARYASINLHKGVEPSRRDDLESVGYILIYFLKGKLPWQGLKYNGTTKTSHIEAIGEVKMNTSLNELCKDVPSCFKMFLQYCRSLHFTDTPDYNYLKGLFTKDASNLGIVPKYQWIDE